MPLRDHFRPPTSRSASWEGFHAMWPGEIVQQLKKQLPPGYVSEPRVLLGPFIEIDVTTFDDDDAPGFGAPDRNGGVATLPWAPPAPSLLVETEPSDDAEYEVRVYDAQRERTLVAAIEIVSPANKDRPEHRNAFVAKCAALLRGGVAVSVVDLVTVRHFNLYAELMAFVGHPDRELGTEPPATYAASCRRLRGERWAVLETWRHTLTVGAPLPTLPLWLAPGLAVPLDLERSYEQACDDLSIP